MLYAGSELTLEVIVNNGTCNPDNDLQSIVSFRQSPSEEST